MRYAFWICVAVLIVFHQDYWQWDNDTLDFGFMPRALSYHVCISIAAAVFWMLVTQFCWPEDSSPRVQSDSSSSAQGKDGS